MTGGTLYAPIAGGALRAGAVPRRPEASAGAGAGRTPGASSCTSRAAGRLHGVRGEFHFYLLGNS